MSVERMIGLMVKRTIKVNTSKHSHGYAYTAGMLEGMLCNALERMDDATRNTFIANFIAPKLADLTTNDN
jgi:hypothetical protein